MAEEGIIPKGRVVGTLRVTEAGVPRKNIRFDKANELIPLPTQTGNLIVTLPGPPLTVLFTVREESGLWGARFVNPADLEHPVLGFNVDGRSPHEITLGALGAERWEAEVIGRASHAGAHPQQGISATVVASLALVEVFEKGWFGKIRKNGQEGTSNVGSIGDQLGRSAGQATNVVTDYALVKGEARSHDARLVRQITTAYRDAFAGRPGKCMAGRPRCVSAGAAITSRSG